MQVVYFWRGCAQGFVSGNHDSTLEGVPEISGRFKVYHLGVPRGAEYRNYFVPEKYQVDFYDGI